MIFQTQLLKKMYLIVLIKEFLLFFGGNSNEMRQENPILLKKHKSVKKTWHFLEKHKKCQENMTY